MPFTLQATVQHCRHIATGFRRILLNQARDKYKRHFNEPNDEFTIEEPMFMSDPICPVCGFVTLHIRHNATGWSMETCSAHDPAVPKFRRTLVPWLQTAASIVTARPAPGGAAPSDVAPRDEQVSSVAKDSYNRSGTN